MAQTFKSKTLLGRSGIFSHQTIAPNLIYNTGNQIISGVKTFAENTTFGDSAQGDFLVISGNQFTVYGSGNFTSGLFVNGNAVLTGIDLSSYATKINLALTGSTLNNSIISLSGLFTGYTGTLDTTFASDIQLANTGSTLQTNINNLSGYINSSSSNIVFTTGDQIISGNKTFKNNVIIEQTGIFNAIDLSDTDSILLSGIDIQIVSGSMTLTNPPTISGNPFITGNLSLYATTINLASSGSTLNNSINSLSGLFTGYTGNLDTTYATDIQLANTGSTLNTKIDNLSGVSVLTFGDQTINGLKTFTSGIDIYSGTSPQSLRIFNSTGINTGEFALIGWQSNLGIVSTGTNALVIGTQSSNSGILRDLIITGENIALSPRSGRLYINGTSSLNDYLLQTSQCSGNITGFITGLGFTGNYTGNYEGGYFLGRTKLTQNTVQLVDSSFGSNFTTKNTSAPTQTFRSVAVSSDGRYQIVAVNNFASSTAGYIYSSNDYGNTWTPRITDTTRTWLGVAISADGKYQVACHYGGYIYISNDYGNTWNAKDSIRNWLSIAISSDGKYQTAVSATGVYISNNYGNTWTGILININYVSIAMSSDGKYQYLTLDAGVGGSIFRSSDYGNTWIVIQTGSSTAYASIATSADGKYVIHNRSSSNNLYISNNYGNTFVAKSTATYYNSVAVSDNGKYMVAGGGRAYLNVGGIYFSSDYGTTWKLITPNSNLWTVAMSSNAKYVLGVCSASAQPIHIFKTDELIDANLTINNNLTLPSGDFYSYNATGVNSGEFGLIGWRNNQFVIGSQRTTSGILRDVRLTGANINLSASGEVIVDNINPIGGNSFIVKAGNDSNGLAFNPTAQGNAGLVGVNWISTIGMMHQGDYNLELIYGGGGTRDIRFIKSSINRAILDSNGNFGIGSGISSVPSRFYVSGNSILQGDLTVSGNTTITGHLSAASKSFLINHPTQVGKKLQYGSLESPYHGIRLTDKNKISADLVKVYLPEYISSLINDEKVNIQLTNINHDKVLFVKEVDVIENNFTVGMNRGWFDTNEYEFYWSFTAERKDIPKLTVEF